MKRNKLIALFAGLSLAFVSSAALAAPSADTLLVAGYDSDQMAVIYGVSDIDQGDEETASLDCALDGTYVYELESESETETSAEAAVEGDGDDGPTKVAVTSVKEKDGDTVADENVEFFYQDDEKQEGPSLRYGDEGAEDCALTSVAIEPNGNGEINHGKVVSTFAKLLKGGNGCLIRHFAQSDFGKGEYEVADGESVDEVLEVTLQSFETACNKKVKSDSVDDDDDSESRGKSNAPGQEKKDQSDKGGKDKAPGQEKKKTQDDDSSSD